MRVIDARSGRTVKVGETVSYPDDHSWTLLAVDDRFFRAQAKVRLKAAPGGSRTSYGSVLEVWDGDRGPAEGGGVVWIPLTVRFTHPSFFGRRVGFFPS